MAHDYRPLLTHSLCVNHNCHIEHNTVQNWGYLEAQSQTFLLGVVTTPCFYRPLQKTHQPVPAEAPNAEEPRPSPAAYTPRTKCAGSPWPIQTPEQNNNKYQSVQQAAGLVLGLNCCQAFRNWLSCMPFSYSGVQFRKKKKQKHLNLCLKEQIHWGTYNSFKWLKHVQHSIKQSQQKTKLQFYKYTELQLNVITVYNNFTHICIKWSHLSKSFVTCS